MMSLHEIWASRRPAGAGAFVALLSAAFLSATPAMAAAPPASVVGGWNAVANTSALTILITAQNGLPSVPCAVITGKLTDNASQAVSPIAGFYCPTTGRFSFLRKDATTHDTSQVYGGNVGPQTPGFLTRMAGSFGEFEQGGARGQYAFYAVGFPP